MLSYLRDMILHGLIIGLFLVSMAVISQANERPIECSYNFPEVEMEL